MGLFERNLRRTLLSIPRGFLHDGFTRPLCVEGSLWNLSKRDLLFLTILGCDKGFGIFYSIKYICIHPQLELEHKQKEIKTNKQTNKKESQESNKRKKNKNIRKISLNHINDQTNLTSQIIPIYTQESLIQFRADIFLA